MKDDSNATIHTGQHCEKDGVAEREEKDFR